MEILAHEISAIKIRLDTINMWSAIFVLSNLPVVVSSEYFKNGQPSLSCE